MLPGALEGSPGERRIPPAANAPQGKSQETWAVVGGGFLGMTLALRLAQQGKTVTLFEAAPFLGGVAAPWRLGDIVWDRHYHVILFSDLHLHALLDELGLKDDLIWGKTRTGFYVDSRLHSISNAFEFLRFPPLTLYGKLRLGAAILRAATIKDWQSLEAVPVEEWLTKWSGSAVTKKVWLPLLRAKLGDCYRETSAVFIWATIARLYGARRTRAKTEVFGYLAGGYARIVAGFHRLLVEQGVSIRLGRAVRSINSYRGGRLQVEPDSGAAETFSNVVVTAASPLAARMCPDLSVEEKDQLFAISYQGIICASLLLENPLSGFYLTNIADSRVPYTAVVEMSALVEPSQFGGRALVYLPKYVSPDSPYFQRTDDEIREEFESALAQMYPSFVKNQCLSFRVSRVRYLLPIPTIHHSRKVPKISTSVRGLYIVNSTQIVDGTLNVNETVRLAESAAQELALRSALGGS